MSKLSKQIPIGTLEKIAKERFSNSITMEWEGIDVYITPTLSLKNVIEFVNNVVESCFDSNGEYHPEIMDFAIQSQAIKKYTNFKLPDSIEKSYELLTTTGIADFILQNVNQIQFHEIVKAIDRKMKYLADTDSQRVRLEVDRISTAFNEISSYITAMMDSVKPEDMSKLFEAISNGGFDEDKLVKAYADHVFAPSVGEDTTGVS